MWSLFRKKVQHIHEFNPYNWVERVYLVDVYISTCKTCGYRDVKRLPLPKGIASLFDRND